MRSLEFEFPAMMPDEDEPNDGKWYFRTTMIICALFGLIALVWIVWADGTDEQNPFPEHPEKKAARGSK